ncbi:pentatricopeptide repeat-containing protein MRL1, chloroplastic [Malania oleifera]|uniref:pentatricopeptide repeat-containing protein MRL1, chloroplastic n=1 Tax=Malania oleifera TaxID=397392 RepID=UPI0025AEB4A2|nr:pentatricopeptide repeat-containing protein MRL1, chloroplastic [Malania oleifera]
MDLNSLLAAKSQAFSLVSCTSISPPSLRSIRRQFLGSGHNLRPPGLRSPRKRNKSGFHIQTSRFYMRASMDSDPFLVMVAAATVFSALVVFYVNYCTRKKTAKEESGQPTLALFQEGNGILISRKFIENWIMGYGDFLRKASAEERKSFVDDIVQDNYPSEDENALQQVLETAFTHEEFTPTKALEPPSSDVLVTSDSDSESIKEFEANIPSPSHILLSYSGVQPLMFVEEIFEMQQERQRKEIEGIAELSTATVKAICSVSLAPVNNAAAEVSRHKIHNYELGEVGGVVTHSDISRKLVREELHTFYVENLSATKLTAESNVLRAVSSHASPMDGHRFSSSRNFTVKGAELSAGEYLHTTDYIRETMPRASYKEDSSCKRKYLGKSGQFPGDRGRKIFPSNNPENLPELFKANDLHVKNKHLPSEKFSDYNRMLRDGRLIECVELLEHLERIGLLDMNKVYHARFFKTCKSQKAGKEAFRFMKLIPNPTLSTFNMLMSVCASSQDSEGAFQVLRLVKETGFKADCKLYTTLISTCAKCGKVDAMFEAFHEMVNAGVEPNVHTYGALIDGCARAGQVPKAFGAYGIMTSKKVKPDRVVFNALITACGQSGAVDRAFDVLAEMRAETQPIEPDHITVGALIKACSNAGQVDRAREVYKMIHQYKIKGTPEVYTIAVNSCSQTGDWDFACNVYDDMTRKGVVLDEMFLSALIDVAGHAGKLDAAFKILHEARMRGVQLGIISYSSLMGACCNAKNWQKALELYEDIKSTKLSPTVPTVNALITALCDGDQLPKAMEVLSEMKNAGLYPNTITYSVLLVASEKKDDLEAGLMLLSQAKKDGVAPKLVMCRCLIGMCLRRFKKACTLGEPALSFDTGRPHLDNEWTSLALMIYRETMKTDVVPTMEVFSQLLGCLQLPHDGSLRNRLIENLGVNTNTSKYSNLCSLIDGFGEYDPRAFSLLEEAASLGIVPCVSLKESPIVIDARKLQIHTAEVYLLTVLKGLKYRLAAGTKLPNITILLPTEKTQIQYPNGEKSINIAGRIGQAVAALLRRVGLPYQGNESFGKIRISGLAIRRWFQPKLGSPFSGKPEELSSSHTWLAKGITHQQRNIRTGNLSLD